MHRIFILGPQGSGKGTQAKKLSAFLGIPYLSMGDLLREEAKGEGELSQKVRAIVETGSLVSDVVAEAVLRKRLAEPDVANGYILDGFPRNFEQMKAFVGFDQPTAVIVIDIPKRESRARLQNRAITEGRTDDTPEVIEKRLGIYSTDTVPIIEEYKKLGVVREVDGMGTIEEVAERIQRLFVL
ncbi:MAG: nucleoside monophosphate kinase [Patescibacteria group bacterium]|jgi:adenylate kinase